MGIQLAKKAVEFDEQAQYEDAMSLYQKTLDYFYRAMSEEHDPNLKKTIGDKLKSYLSRAEQIKTILAVNANPSAPPLIPDINNNTSDFHDDPSCEFCKVVFRNGESYKVFQEKLYHMQCVDKAAGTPPFLL